MNVVVNGRHFDLKWRSLSYDDVLLLAGDSPGASVTYCLPSTGAGGVLSAGDRIVLGEGAVFNVCRTGGA